MSEKRYTKSSRYRKQPSLSVPDAKGRTLKSTALRPTPPAVPRFEHVIRDRDRLDHLAWKYYKEPRKWWRICDAERRILWPGDLLDESPVRTEHHTLLYFDATGTAGEPRWALVRDAVRKVGGVLHAAYADRETPPERIPAGGGMRYTRVLEVRRNIRYDAESEHGEKQRTLLEKAVAESGFIAGGMRLVERTGQRLDMPANVIT